MQEIFELASWRILKLYSHILDDSVNFLLFTYFKIDSGSVDVNELVAKAIETAYMDATIQKAYNYYLGVEREKERHDDNGNLSIDDRSVKAHRSCSEYLKTTISTLLESETQNEYDKQHKQICDCLVTKYMNQDIPFFTYGNAQKWINMTMKYLCVICGAMKPLSVEMNGVNQFCNLIEGKAQFFHIPLDSYILRALYEFTEMKKYISPESKISYRVVGEYKNSGDEYDLFDTGKGTNHYMLVDRKIKKNEGSEISEDICKKPWSEIESYNLYFTIVLKMREILNVQVPLEWESKYWIEIARKRRKADKEFTEC